jgi:hypothetical protein
VPRRLATTALFEIHPNARETRENGTRSFGYEQQNAE